MPRNKQAPRSASVDFNFYSQNVVAVEFDQLFTALENWCTAVTKTSGFVTALFRLLHIVDLSSVYHVPTEDFCMMLFGWLYCSFGASAVPYE